MSDRIPKFSQVHTATTRTCTEPDTHKGVADYATSGLKMITLSFSGLLNNDCYTILTS